MTADGSQVLQRLLDEYRECGALLLLFDFDGTLAPIVEHPRLAKLDWGVRRLLERLSRRPGIHLGILSARRLDDLKAICCLSNVFYAGVCGLEMDFHGTRIVHPDTRYMSGAIALVRELLDRAIAEYPGAWIEDKQWAITVHYRQVPWERIAALLSSVDEALAPVRDLLALSSGPMAIEIGLQCVWEKSHVVRALAQAFRVPGRVTLYAGDGDNDREAFRAVDSLGGIALGIGPQSPSNAHYRLPDPASLHAVLVGLERALENPKAGRRRDAEEYLALYGFWKSTTRT